jgi:hypothetical protein
MFPKIDKKDPHFFHSQENTRQDGLAGKEAQDVRNRMSVVDLLSLAQ